MIRGKHNEYEGIYSCASNISLQVMSSMVLTLSTVVQASSNGLKLYLVIDTNLNDEVIISTYQHGDRV